MDKATLDPTTLIIFGATGDLAQRKLIPAIFHLFSNGYLPEHFQVIGLSKENQTDQFFRQFARDIIQKKSPRHRPQELDEFLTRLHYQIGLFEKPDTYASLAKKLQTLDNQTFHRCSNKLFYLAVPPVLYQTIFSNLSQSGLTIPCGGNEGWTRILVEKPFGHNLKTAQELDQKLGQLFQEEQIFRIDHYLAKETVQNIITFRFANSLFEPVWNKDYIDRVDIRVWETLGIGERARFYEDVGALRDVGQNHLLQMLALTAMPDPQELSATAIRAARANVLKKLRPVTTQDVTDRTVRAQYTDYREEVQSITSESNTETYFRVTTYLDDPRWQNVPFVLESGKKMAEDRTEITITFKERQSCVCPPDDNILNQNILTIRLQPNEGIILRFWAKKPGLTYELEPKNLSFFYSESADDLVLPDAYEKVLYDCIRGDQTLFASTDEVSAAWRFITPILENWQTTPLLTYQPGSTGPKT